MLSGDFEEIDVRKLPEGQKKSSISILSLLGVKEIEFFPEKLISTFSELDISLCS